MIERSTDIKAALRSRQRGFLLNPFRFGSGGGDPYFSNVSLLLHMDGSNASTTFTDSSGSPKTITVSGSAGSAQISTAQSKFGGASGVFSGGQIAAPDGTSLNLSTGDFTIEFWFMTSMAGTGVIASRYNGNAISRNDLQWLIQFAGGVVKATPYSGEADYTITCSGTWNDGAWHHQAFVRNGNVFSVYIDGTMRGSTTQAITLNNGAWPTAIGNYFEGGSPIAFAGYIDDFRITKGVARYTANFTPPTAPFPNS